MVITFLQAKFTRMVEKQTIRNRSNQLGIACTLFITLFLIDKQGLKTLRATYKYQSHVEFSLTNCLAKTHGQGLYGCLKYTKKKHELNLMGNVKTIYYNAFGVNVQDIFSYSNQLLKS